MRNKCSMYDPDLSVKPSRRQTYAMWSVEAVFIDPCSISNNAVTAKWDANEFKARNKKQPVNR